MRTTLSLDDDLLEKARSVARQRRLPLKTIVNEALRLGLSRVEVPVKRKPYRTIPHAMGRRDGYNLDCIQKLLAKAEGEDYR